MKKKLLILIALVALVSAITASTAAAASGSHTKVRGIANIAWLGPANFLQSASGDASLFADGTMKGNVIASAPNGQIVLHAAPVSWSWLVQDTLWIFSGGPYRQGATAASTYGVL